MEFWNTHNSITPILLLLLVVSFAAKSHRDDRRRIDVGDIRASLADFNRRSHAAHDIPIDTDANGVRWESLLLAIREPVSWLANSEQHLVNKPAASSKPVVARISGGAILEIINKAPQIIVFVACTYTVTYITMVALLRKHREEKTSVSSSTTLDCVIPAWRAGIQVDMDIYGGILASLDAGNPCRHDEDLYFHVL